MQRSVPFSSRKHRVCGCDALTSNSEQEMIACRNAQVPGKIFIHNGFLAVRNLEQLARSQPEETICDPQHSDFRHNNPTCRVFSGAL